MWIDSRFTFSMRKTGCPNFVQVVDYSIFKRMDHCLKKET